MNKIIKITLTLMSVLPMSSTISAMIYERVDWEDPRKGYIVRAVDEDDVNVVIPESIEVWFWHEWYTGYVIGIESMHYRGIESNVKTVKMSSSIRYIGYEALESLDIKEIDIPDRCATVGDGAFRNCVLLERVSFGTGVSSLFSGEYKGDSRGETFKGCTSLRLIESYAKVPPSAYENTFEGVPVDECVLVVPRGTVEAYRRSPAFGVFKNIKERTYTPIGIEDVNDDSAINFNGGLLTSGKDGLSVAVYSVDGRKVVSRVLPQGESLELPGRGVYIVVADGKSRKIAY